LQGGTSFLRMGEWSVIVTQPFRAEYQVKAKVKV
jgi:hypothetical protein